MWYLFQAHVSTIFGFRMSNNVRKCKFYLWKVNLTRCKHLPIFPGAVNVLCSPTSERTVTYAIITAPNLTLIWKIMSYSERTFFCVHFEGEQSISTYNIFLKAIIFQETAPTPSIRHFRVQYRRYRLLFTFQQSAVMHLVAWKRCHIYKKLSWRLEVFFYTYG